MNTAQLWKTDLTNSENKKQTRNRQCFLRRKQDLQKTDGPQSSYQLKLIKCYQLICGILSISFHFSTIDLL